MKRPEPLNTRELIETQLRASDGDVKAIFNLGVHYMAVEDRQTAMLYYKKAADGGFGPALFAYGYHIFNQDNRAAFKCFRRGATLGDKDCLLHLATCYERGAGTSIDLKRALQLYQAVVDSDAKQPLKDYAAQKIASWPPEAPRLPTLRQMGRDEKAELN